MRPARTIVLCADDAGANTLPTPSSAEIIRYGVQGARATGGGASDARLVASNVRATDGRTAFDVSFDGEALGALSLRVPGLHNVRNALAAVASGLALGASLDAMRAGLERVVGADPRFHPHG